MVKDKSQYYKKSFAKGKAEGRIEGKLEEQKTVALNMLKKNLDKELIAEITGLTLNQLNNLARNL